MMGPRVQLGSTGIGIQVGEGVVLAVEKRVTSKLLEPSSIEKIVEIDQHMGMPVDHHPLRALSGDHDAGCRCSTPLSIDAVSSVR